MNSTRLLKNAAWTPSPACSKPKHPKRSLSSPVASELESPRIPDKQQVVPIDGGCVVHLGGWLWPRGRERQAR